MQYWRSVYASGVVFSDATTVSGGAFSVVAGRTSSGVSLKSGAVSINGSGVALSDGVVLADGTTRTNSTLRSPSGATVLGDATAAMQPAPWIESRKQEGGR